jgi:uncharacterized repeat protein (TIGR03803 family)
LRIFGFSRSSLCSCVAAAMLAGCGGSQPPIATPGAVPQRSAITTSAGHGKSWMQPEQSSLAQAKRYEVVHGFATFRDGAEPEKLIVVDNRVYGTTFAGGFQGKKDCKEGCGVLFNMAMDGSGYRVLHKFQGGTDGAGPTSITVVDNAIFGVTYQGGGGPCPDYGFGFTGCGTVFRILPDGSGYAQLHVFTTRNGKGSGDFPADVIFYHGDLYGTTLGGGGKCHPNGCGTIFRMSSHGTGFAIVHAFSGGRDGASPGDGLAVMGDALFGTTQNGGRISKGLGTGTIFRVSEGSKYKQLFSLQRYGMPEAGLLAYGGLLFGTTATGGKPACPHGCGSVFSIRPNGTGFSVLYAFDSLTSAVAPEANLVSLGGVLYGTSSAGGTHCQPGGCGTVFSISPSRTNFQVAYSFKGGAQGAGPGEIVPVGTSIYGVAGAGPSCGHYGNCGIAFELQTAVP